MTSIPNNELWHEFFHVFKSLPELWKVNSEDFKDKKKRRRGLQKLMSVYLLINPKANIDGLKQKLNNIRSCFRRELRKVEESERSGATADDVYVPNLWYYEPLLFLRGEHDEKQVHVKHQPRQQQQQLKTELEYSNDSFDPLNEEEFEELVEQTETSETSSMRKRRHVSVDEHFKSYSSTIDEERREPISRERAFRADRRERSRRDRAEVADCERRDARDEAGIFADCWATSYRKLNEEQRLYAKKAIDDILLLGQLNKLRLQTVPLNKMLYADADKYDEQF